MRSGNFVPLADSLLKGADMVNEKPKKANKRESYDPLFNQVSKIHIAVALYCFKVMLNQINKLFNNSMKPETIDYINKYHKVLYFQNLEAELTSVGILKGKENDKPKTNTN